ncbi:porin [Paraburkholderia phytofirmans]|uniref:porin n=1 Tax=Paraburkholderia phytofirmans TaxID=261302 RepID=UPI0038BA0DDE
MKPRHIGLVMLVHCCLPAAASAQDLSIPFNENATRSQYLAVFEPIAIGGGPASTGIQPGNNFVSLYGSVDMAVNYTNAGGKSVVRLQSGNVWTSKFGIYGQEDLGAQWTAFFRLESGFYANNGAVQDTSSLFNRGSFVGVTNPVYGQLSMGRQYTSLGSVGLGADPFYANAHDAVFTYMAGGADLGVGATADGLGRLHNTLRYQTPRIRGLAADVSYTFKADQSPGPAVNARTAAISYAGYASVIGLAFAQAWCDPTVVASCTGTPAVAATIRTDTFLASALHDFGPVVLQAAYLRTAPNHPGDGIANLYLLGAQKMWRGNLLRASLAYRDTTIEQNYAYGTTLGIDHFLSKRTALYARAGLIKNGPRSNLTYNYDSTSASTLVGYGASVTSFTVGMYTNF